MEKGKEKKENLNISGTTLSSLCAELRKNNRIPPEKFARYHVKRGLRNEDGTGVMAGLTLICNVHGYVINEGERAGLCRRVLGGGDEPLLGAGADGGTDGCRHGKGGNRRKCGNRRGDALKTDTRG